jgi:hypothetical protein
MMEAYPGVLRGFGLAMVLTVPSCMAATCGRAIDGPSPTPLACARFYEPVVVDRKVAPDGTELCVTQVLDGGGEPYTVWFNVRRPGAPWKRYFLANAPFWIGEIEMRSSDGTAVARYDGNEVVFDWVHGYRFPHYVDPSGMGPRDIADPFARER